jgi:23S rRNA pseudouridine1911/1915/1917 synthase
MNHRQNRPRPKTERTGNARGRSDGLRENTGNTRGRNDGLRENTGNSRGLGGGPRGSGNGTATGRGRSPAGNDAATGAGRSDMKRGRPVQSDKRGNGRGNRADSSAESQRSFGQKRAEPARVRGSQTPAPAERPARPQPKAKQFTVQEPMELLPFLLQHLNEGRNSVKSILARGQVSVGDHTITAYNYPLQSGMKVTISKEKVNQKPPLIGLVILHEDEDVIVVLKEAGLLSIASDKAPDEPTAYRQLMEHVRQNNPQNRIFIVHRLDRDTSGVMMFAKSEEMQQKLQNTWQDSVRERTYVALVEGKVKKAEDTITSWLKESKTLKMYSSPYPNDGQQAITHYRAIQTNAYFSLLEVELETGRKNQIRAHMEYIGHPVAGDKKYGSRTSPIGRLGLHARVLTFEHPRTGKTMRFETDIPKLFLRVFREE